MYLNETGTACLHTSGDPDADGTDHVDLHLVTCKSALSLKHACLSIFILTVCALVGTSSYGPKKLLAFVIEGLSKPVCTKCGSTLYIEKVDLEIASPYHDTLNEPHVDPSGLLTIHIRVAPDNEYTSSEDV